MGHKEQSGAWLRHVSQGDAIERVNTDNTTLSLLASKNGTEIIHHTLKQGTVWALGPQEGWDELESVFVISGKLKYVSGNTHGVLLAGDTLSAEPVREYIVFTAVDETVFLYICSNYVFHNYSEITRKFQKLAVEIEEKDGYTSSHCERIRRESVLIGERIGLSSQEIISLNFGAFFHDIGKIKIPNNILLKTERLSLEEFDIIKKHTIYGKEILSSSRIPHLESGSIIAEQHHERFDGSGYPYGLIGEEISIGAAIVAVVDSYDAMISNRPYKRAKSRSEAMDEIRSYRGKLYHPLVVDTFLDVAKNFDNLLNEEEDLI